MRTSFNLSQKISFPKSTPDGFPLETLLDEYLANLIPVTPLHSELAELLFGHIGVDAARNVLCRFMVNRFPTSSIEEMEETEGVDDVVRHLGSLLSKGSALEKYDRALRRYLRASLGASSEHKSHRPVCYNQKLKRLGSALGISFEALQIMEFAACYQLSREFMRYCDQYHSSDWPYLMAKALDLSPQKIDDLMNGEQGLISKGFLSLDTNDMNLQELLFGYMVGLRNDFIDPGICTRAPASPYPLDSFPVSSEDLDLIQQTLSAPGGGHLLFYGRPGTGKTELAKVLGHSKGFDPLLVSCGKDGSQQERRLAITTALSMSSGQTMFILDEADSLLNSFRGFFQPEVDKSWVNHFLDTCPRKVIWITNDVDDIPASVLRRFAYSLRFDTFTDQQRRSTWDIQLEQHQMRPWLNDSALNRLVQAYPTDAGAIASAVDVTQKLYAERQPDSAKAEATLGSLLSHHVRLSGIREPARKRRKVTDAYDPKALHTDTDPQQVLQSLKAYEKREMEKKNLLSATLLFWGLPGTGKTQFATYLAEQLGRPLIQKRMSDLQSKYLGETEKQIAAAFEEAEQKQGILLLDEADSLFIDRTTAQRSWESSQTNEVLTRMEEFQGICICCTNLLENLDRAALRRFIWKIEFKALRPEGRERLYRTYFQPRGRLSQAVRSRLAGMDHLTPGDFHVVRKQSVMGRNTLGADQILNALEAEQSYKRRSRQDSIGFSV